MSEVRKKIFDWASAFTIVATFVLFVVAAFVKGWTKELLLEIGVLLVSIKLILAFGKVNDRLARIESKLDETNQKNKPN